MRRGQQSNDQSFHHVLDLCKKCCEIHNGKWIDLGRDKACNTEMQCLLPSAPGARKREVKSSGAEGRAASTLEVSHFHNSQPLGALLRTWQT